jgi:hypothetical protein
MEVVATTVSLILSHYYYYYYSQRQEYFGGDLSHGYTCSSSSLYKYLLARRVSVL